MLINGVYVRPQGSNVTPLEVRIIAYPDHIRDAKMVQTMLENMWRKHIEGDLPDDFYEPEEG